MSFTSHEIGRQGESRVVEYLVQLGWHIETRNFRGRTGEIDIIARSPESRVFVEVKSSQGQPRYESLLPRQVRRIRRAAQEYLQSQGLSPESNTRFDVIWVWGPEARIEHCENAF